MDFDDTPDEAAFRSRVRTTLDEHAGALVHVGPVLGFLGTVVEIHSAGPLVGGGGRRSVSPVPRNGQR